MGCRRCAAFRGFRNAILSTVFGRLADSGGFDRRQFCRHRAAGADATPPALAKGVPEPVRLRLQQTCYDCHNADVQEGQLNLAALTFDLADAKTFARWVKVYDRVEAGEMPPKDEAPLADETRQSFLSAYPDRLSPLTRNAPTRWPCNLATIESLRVRKHPPRSARAPWLQIKEILPEDGEAFRFNKVGDGARRIARANRPLSERGRLCAARGDCQGHSRPRPTRRFVTTPGRESRLATVCLRARLCGPRAGHVPDHWF